MITSGTSSFAICCGIVLVLYGARSLLARPLLGTGVVLAAVAIGGLVVFSARTLADNYAGLD